MRSQLPAMSSASTCFARSTGSGNIFFAQSSPYLKPSVSWLPFTKSFSTTCPSGARLSGNTRFHTLAWNCSSDIMPRWAMSPQCTTASTFWSRKYESALRKYVCIQPLRGFPESAAAARCVSLTTPNTMFGFFGGFHPGGAANTRQPPPTPTPSAESAPFRNPRRDTFIAFSFPANTACAHTREVSGTRSCCRCARLPSTRARTARANRPAAPATIPQACPGQPPSAS